MTKKVGKKFFILVALAFLAIVAVYFNKLHMKTHLGDQETKQTVVGASIRLSDQEPFEPPCAFWEPWKVLVSPGSPVDYLTVISQMLEGGAERTSQYIDLIMRDPGMMGALRGDAEEICIAGMFSGLDGKYQMTADRSNVCSLLPQKFLEQNLAIKIAPVKSGGFDNHIKYKIHVGSAVPAKFRSFWMMQMELMKKGYRGWSKAFNEYFKVNNNGFGLVSIQQGGSGASTNAAKSPQTELFTELRLDWLTQAMMSTQIDWATFLLKLGDLAKVEMWSQTDFAPDYSGEKKFEGKLLATKIETRLSSILVQIPHQSEHFFKEIMEVPIVIGHDVLVKFRGIEVLVKGLKYRGILHSDDSQYGFDGFFDGVDQVEITGAYRGIGMTSSIGKIIHNLVQEIIDREIARLKKGHNGQPAKLRIGLYKNGHEGQFEFETRFEAAVNVLNIIREEKDQVDSPVMPNKKTIKDLNQWAKLTINSLIIDYKDLGKKGLCTTP